MIPTFDNWPAGVQCVVATYTTEKVTSLCGSELERVGRDPLSGRGWNQLIQLAFYAPVTCLACEDMRRDMENRHGF